MKNLKDNLLEIFHPGDLDNGQIQEIIELVNKAELEATYEAVQGVYQSYLNDEFFDAEDFEIILEDLKKELEQLKLKGIVMDEEEKLIYRLLGTMEDAGVFLTGAHKLTQFQGRAISRALRFVWLYSTGENEDISISEVIEKIKEAKGDKDG